MSDSNPTFDLPAGLQKAINLPPVGQSNPEANQSSIRVINAVNHQEGVGMVYLVSGEDGDTAHVDVVMYDPKLDTSKQATRDSFTNRRVASFVASSDKTPNLVDGNGQLDIKQVIGRVNARIADLAYMGTSEGLRLEASRVRIALSTILPELSSRHSVTKGVSISTVDVQKHWHKGVTQGTEKLLLSISPAVFNRFTNSYISEVMVGYHEGSDAVISQQRSGVLSSPIMSFKYERPVTDGAWGSKDQLDIEGMIDRAVKNYVSWSNFKGTVFRKKLIENVKRASYGKVEPQLRVGDKQRRMTVPTAIVVDVLNEHGCLELEENLKPLHGKTGTHVISSLDKKEWVSLAYIPLVDALNPHLTFTRYVDGYKCWNRSDDFRQTSFKRSDGPQARTRMLVSQFVEANVMTFSDTIRNIDEAVDVIIEACEMRGLDDYEFKTHSTLSAVGRLGPDPLESPTGTEKEVDWSGIAEARGLSSETIKECESLGLIQMISHPDDFRGGPVSLAAGCNGSLLDDRVMAHQMFSPNHNGKMSKMFGANSACSRAAFIYGDKSKAETVVWTEATFDAMALKELFNKHDPDTDLRMVMSVNSTAYLAGVLSHNFGLELPTKADIEKGIAGYLQLPEPDTVLDGEAAEGARMRAILSMEMYESVVFVDDGTPESQLALTALRNVCRDDVAITVDHSPSRVLTGNYDYQRKAIEHLFIDKTNYDLVLGSAAIEVAPNGEPIYLERGNRFNKANIFHPSHLSQLNPKDRAQAEKTLQEAKERVLERLPNCQTMLFGFDNDMPGMSQALQFKALFGALGYGGHIMVPPVLSRKDAEISMADVHHQFQNQKREIVGNYANPNYQFNPTNMVNDWNDLLRLDSTFDTVVRDFIDMAIEGDYPVSERVLFETAYAVDKARSHMDLVAPKPEPNVKRGQKMGM